MKSLFLVLAGCLIASVAPAADLLAVYQRALQNDPQLKEAEATRLASLESKPQAIAALLPQISGSGTISRERDKGQSNQTEEVQANGQNFVESFPFNGRVNTTTHKYGVDLSQNLFNWDNWVALKRADAQVAQADQAPAGGVGQVGRRLELPDPRVVGGLAHRAQIAKWSGRSDSN